MIFLIVLVLPEKANNFILIKKKTRSAWLVKKQLLPLFTLD